VKIGGGSSTATFVMADIPGLIPGASEGAGLGVRFLKHVERCRALLHLVAPPTDELREEGREPLADFDALMNELRAFAPELAKRPMIVAMSKGDLPETQDVFEAVKKKFAKRKIPLRLISAATGQGVADLARDLYRLVKGHAPELDDAEAYVAPEIEAPSEAPVGEPAHVERAERPRAKKKAASVGASTKSKQGAAKSKPAKKGAAKRKPAKKGAAKSKPAKKGAAASSGTKKTSTKRAPAKTKARATKKAGAAKTSARVTKKSASAKTRTKTKPKARRR
jgi:GTP-binding protein